MIYIPRLAEVTRNLLKNRPRTTTLDVVAATTGLNKAWLNDFIKYPERDHGVNKVETLYHFLSGEKLLNDDDK